MFDSQGFYTSANVALSSDQSNIHHWVTVRSPINKRSLLQACDNCGAVKSENTLSTSCHAEQAQHIITSSLHTM